MKSGLSSRAYSLERKVDVIVKKSVSRFARNTVDSLMMVRELKKISTLSTASEATDYYNVLTCSGGNSLHFRKHEMGVSGEICGRQGQPSIQIS